MNYEFFNEFRFVKKNLMESQIVVTKTWFSKTNHISKYFTLVVFTTFTFQTIENLTVPMKYTIYTII